MTFLLVFFSAALFEGLYLGWVMCAGRGLALPAALFSVATGALSLYGVSATVHDPSRAPALLLGYFVGSYLVVRLTGRPRGGMNTG